MSRNPLHELTTFLLRLENGKIHYTLASHRDDAIMVLAAVPGERWEIEFFADGSVEVERFISEGKIATKEALEELFEKHAEPERAEMT